MQPRTRTVAALLGSALLAAQLTGPAFAEDKNDFGPPWLGQVVRERAAVHAQPADGSPTTGDVANGTLVPVIADAGGGAWLQIPSGFVARADMQEERAPVLAKVTRDGVQARRGPNGGAEVRRELKAGDLVRATGLSPGVDGDKGVWWATTDGWVPLDSLQQSPAEAAAQYTLPQADEAPRGWWGEVNGSANVRAAANLQSPVIGELDAGALVKVLSEEQGEDVGGEPTWYRIDGGRYAGGRIHKSLVARIEAPKANTTKPDPAPDDGTWVVVDRQASTLTMVENGQPTLVTYASLGTSFKDTPAGKYATLGKYRYQDMTSQSVPEPSHQYDIPNVPFTVNFKEGGFAIHGAYWHDDFGKPHSDGCVNLTLADAAFVFDHTRPKLVDGNSIWTDAQYATPVVVVG